MGRLIPQEESNAERQGDKGAEEGSKVEEEDGRQEDESRGFHSLQSKQRGEGFPNLIENDRNGEEEAGIEGQFENGEKGFGNGKGH